MKQRSFLSILCLVFVHFSVFASVSAQTCIENRKNFIPNGTYDGNRRLILSSLPSNAADGFYNGSIGQVPNRVYAVGMCIPQADANDCSACIEGASDFLIQSCINQTDAYYWGLDPTLCLVRYSNVSFSESAAFWEITPQYLVYNTADINSKNVTEFKTIWERFIRGMIAEASAARNHYKADVAALTPFQNMYALMQCTPDISSGDCDNCLRQSVIDYQSCCAEKTGGYVMRPICFFRWQMFTFSKAFGNITLAPPPSPSRPPPPQLRRQPPSSASDRAKTIDNNSRKFSVRSIVAISVLVVCVVILILGLLARVFCWRRNSYQEVELNPIGITTVRCLKYNFETIEAATDSFSERNRIGRGGFGEVFKGTLPNGDVIAVKRLFRATRQSEEDFKNEVLVVANLEHTNLVRLLGFSVRGVERILVYEFMLNKSLDYFLFDPPTEQGRLDWTKRYNIIRGITQGILYLHQYSRPPIIHRDLKAANILLDADMNPKICDFGMARIFGMSQSVDNTGRIVGTLGYMPPEHERGTISKKTDVYSFGVLVLEIVCGKRTLSFNQEGTTESLVTHAWRLWGNRSPLDLVDSTIADNYPIEEVTRCIHIALLCVQLERADRPDMSTINEMLTSDTFVLPVPKPPGSYFPNRPGLFATSSIYHSTNDKIVED